MKAAAYLDLGVRQAKWKTCQRKCAVRLPERVASMLHRPSLSWEIAHGDLSSYSTKELTEARKTSKLQCQAGPAARLVIAMPIYHFNLGIPAAKLVRFVTRSGIHGDFRLECDEHYRFLKLKSLGASGAPDPDG